MPPPAAIASFAACACRARFRLQGVVSPAAVTTPMNGLSKSSSDSPRPRRKARCGARVRPRVTMRERSSLAAPFGRLSVVTDPVGMDDAARARVGLPEPDHLAQLVGVLLSQVAKLRRIAGEVVELPAACGDPGRPRLPRRLAGLPHDLPVAQPVRALAQELPADGELGVHGRVAV